MTSSAGEKNVQQHRSSILAAAGKPGVFFCGIFLTFRQKNWRAFVMLSAGAWLQRKIAPTAGAKSYRMRAEAGRWAPWSGAGLRGLHGALGVALFDADDRADG